MSRGVLSLTQEEGTCRRRSEGYRIKKKKKKKSRERKEGREKGGENQEQQAGQAGLRSTCAHHGPLVSGAY